MYSNRSRWVSSRLPVSSMVAIDLVDKTDGLVSHSAQSVA